MTAGAIRYDGWGDPRQSLRRTAAGAVTSGTLAGPRGSEMRHTPAAVAVLGTVLCLGCAESSYEKMTAVRSTRRELKAVGIANHNAPADGAATRAPAAPE